MFFQKWNKTWILSSIVIYPHQIPFRENARTVDTPQTFSTTDLENPCWSLTTTETVWKVVQFLLDHCFGRRLEFLHIIIARTSVISEPLHFIDNPLPSPFLYSPELLLDFFPDFFDRFQQGTHRSWSFTWDLHDGFPGNCSLPKTARIENDEAQPLIRVSLRNGWYFRHLYQK